MNANSASAPGIVMQDRQEIIDRSEVYSGVYGRASINFYACSNGNKGIACGLNNLQKIRLTVSPLVARAVLRMILQRMKRKIFSDKQ